MITLTTPRHFAEFAHIKIFTYVDLLKKTQLKNLEGLDKKSQDHLSIRVYHSLLDEVDLLFKKKLINSVAPNIKIKMSVAAAIAFYKLLLSYPIPAHDFYFQRNRNLWVEYLDHEIFK